MPRFTVRIELYNGSNGADQKALDGAMTEQGFTRVIRNEGKQFRLPTAEYRMLGDRSRAQVCRRARAGAASIEKDCGILVTEGQCSWHNLRVASA